MKQLDHDKVTWTAILKVQLKATVRRYYKIR